MLILRRKPILTEKADAGADAFLVVAPYYNKPSQEGLFQHFPRSRANRKTNCIVFNSSRCGIEISTQTVLRLRDKFPHVCALKEAGGRSSKVSETVVSLDSDSPCFQEMMASPSLYCMWCKRCGDVASNLIPKRWHHLLLKQ